MPLVAAGLSAAMRAALLSDPETGAVDDTPLTAFCDVLAQAIVTYVVANAVVTVPPGVAVTVAIPAGTGATVAPGVGAIT